jgi:hypothetical protein
LTFEPSQRSLKSSTNCRPEGGSTERGVKCANPFPPVADLNADHA